MTAPLAEETKALQMLFRVARQQSARQAASEAITT
jgi:hypothetical protein